MYAWATMPVFTSRNRTKCAWPLGLLLCATVAACNVKQTHMILIALDDMQGASASLAQELLAYEPFYLVQRIPSLRPEMWTHIRWGTRLSPGKSVPGIWVELDLASEKIREVHETLAGAFETGFREIAVEHIQHAGDFEALEERGARWLRSFMDEPSNDDLFEATTQAFRSSDTRDRLIEAHRNVRTNFGELRDLELVSKQYYRGGRYVLEDGQWGDDRIVLIYDATFAKEGDVYLVVVFDGKDGWKLSSFTTVS